MTRPVAVSEPRKRILVVEDDPFCRRLLEVALSTFPVEVVAVADAESALDLIEDLDPQIVFLDLILPRLGGIDVIEWIRRHPKLGRLPIVVTTSLDERLVSIEAREAGATRYVVKPILPDQLALLLDDLIGVEKG